MVPSSGAVLGGDSREVADVLGEYGIAGGGGQHLWIRCARKPKVRDRGGLNPRRLERTGDDARVHLVDEDLHRASAAAVSLR